MNVWQTSQFETLFLVPLRNGVYKKKEFHGKGQKVVNMGELFSFDFISNQNMERVELSEDEKAKALLKNGDLLFARRSLVLEGSGKCSLVKDLQEETTFESSIIRVRLDQNIANPLFYYYYFHSPNGRSNVISIASQTAVSGITGSSLAKLIIPTPSLKIQNTIANTLEIYDTLIENNKKRIKNLEELAQLRHTEWFVKFKFPGHEKVKMVNSGTDLGMIPEGWSVAPIKKITDFINGFPFKPEDLGEEGYPVIKIPELRSGILEKTPRNTGEGLNKKYLVQTGDILFSWSATLLVNIWNSGTGLLNQHLFKVNPREEHYKAFTLYTLTILVKKISKQVVGATMQHLRRGTVENAQILLPSKAVLQEYEETASKIIDEISTLYRENQNLTKSRDLLIQQLVTGKKEVKIQ